MRCSSHESNRLLWSYTHPTFASVSQIDVTFDVCTACRNMDFNGLPNPISLSYEELARIVHVFAQLGIQKVRITGGEPTMRADICTLCKSMSD